ncbi:MAG TPA: hypothetical protein VFY66_15805 [Anaerolineales bacterium]|nr:hypothetical protein [Anaerolineales bacterium]
MSDIPDASIHLPGRHIALFEGLLKGRQGSGEQYKQQYKDQTPEDADHY